MNRFVRDKKLSVPELTAIYTSPAFEQKFTYSGNDLGANYSPSETTWKLWSPVADQVVLKLYATGSDAEKGARSLGSFHMDVPNKAGVWQLTLVGDYRNVYYTYEVTALGKTYETMDLYAKAAGVNGKRSMVVDLSKTNPKGWEADHYHFDKPSTQAIIWEVHVRDFSYSESSGMKHRGKFLAFTETGTTVNNDGIHPTGVDYLKQLGVTHVHLLPVADYATVDEAHPRKEQFNWGYDPLNYNVPEGSYSTNPYDGNVRIKEMKEMVLALHKAGIGVIMDVVYNHTYYTEESWFQKTVPYYYHRTLPDGRFGDASGCGNETASERSMVRKYIIDSLKYWATEYHIDGFRFDLMGVHDVDTMNEIRKELDKLPHGMNLITYGEPWSALPTCMPEPFIPANKWNADKLNRRIAIFNDETRDSIKGSTFDVKHSGFVNGGSGLEDDLEWAIRAHCGPEERLNAPTQTITYVSAHDNYTLWDKITETVHGDDSGYDSPELIRIAVNKMAAAIVMTSQGIPFFQAGEEFGRTKYGDHNSYKSASKINALDWTRTITFAELLNYYKGLIKIRKSFTPFSEKSDRSARRIHFTTLKEYQVAYTLEGMLEGEPAMVAVCFNAGPVSRNIELVTWAGKTVPEDWQIVANEAVAGVRPLSEVKGSTLRVYTRGVMIAFSKEKKQPDEKADTEKVNSKEKEAL